MNEVETEIAKLGINCITKHNEVAPCQHEIVVQYNVANIAADQNMIVTEIMQKIAEQNDLVCLLTEKPFAGINGSGKHNNWSIWTDDGLNLLEPGKDPYHNLVFLTFLTAVISAVDEYQAVLRASATSYDNFFRLGGHEAPPAIISMYLGDELDDLVEAIIRGKPYEPKVIESSEYFITSL